MANQGESDQEEDRQEEKKSRWEKLDIILKPIGGLFTGLAVAYLGYKYDIRQSDDTSARLYADLMSRREEADSTLRKDMLNQMISTFVKTRPGDLDQQLLRLELLAYNFHDAVDLGPLFKDINTQIIDSQSLEGRQAHINPSKDRALDRLQKLAIEVTSKQIAILEEAGEKKDGFVELDKFDDKGDPKPDGKIELIPITTSIKRDDVIEDAAPLVRHFLVEVIRVDRKRKELLVKLQVKTPGKAVGNGKNVDDIEKVFWVGFFDFPMIDNTRLSHGQRCAVMLTKFEEVSAEITLIYFPGIRASLKEKPFYDEIVRELRKE